MVYILLFAFGVFLFKGNIDHTIKEACNLSNSEEIVVICGSTTFMNEARKAVGIIEPVDKWDLNKMDGIKDT